MVKKVIALFFSILCAVSLIMIFYWKDSHFDPNLKDLLIYFICIPLLLTALVILPFIAIAQYNKYQKNKQEQLDKKQIEPAVVEQKKPIEWINLNLYSTSLQHALGENEAIFQNFSGGISAQLDALLSENLQAGILSYRIEELDQALDEQRQNNAIYRINHMILNQLELNQEALIVIADQLKQSALFYDSQQAYAYKMHPKWIDPNAASEEMDTPPAKPMQRLNYLNIHIFLSKQIQSIWDESTCSEEIQMFIDNLGIISQQLRIHFHYFDSQNSYLALLDLFKHIAHQNHEVSLLVVADSEIDEQILTTKFELEHYIPSEFSSSCCLSHESVTLECLEPIQTLQLALNESQFAQILKELQLDDDELYEHDTPFIVVSNDVFNIKNQKILAQNFADTAIASQHFIYGSLFLGHSQDLAEIFGFMLGTHLSGENFTSVYNTKNSSVQLLLRPFSA